MRVWAKASRGTRDAPHGISMAVWAGLSMFLGFGEDMIGITLGQNVPFFGDIASDYFARQREESVECVQLEDALNGQAQRAVGTVLSAEFLVLQQKLAAASGQRIPKFPDDQVEIHAKIVELAMGQNG